MASCPNCGRATERTQDWVCQWCGYPLPSGSFRQIAKTYQEMKAERLQDLAAVDVAGTDIQEKSEVSEAPEVIEDVPEEAVESGIAEAEMAVAAESEIKPEPAPEPVAEAESTSESEPAEEDSVEVDETHEPVADTETPEPPGIINITIKELSEACEADSEAAEARFTGSILQITAEVGRIPEVESSENPCIILISSEEPTSMNVLCIFDKRHGEEINRLSEGQLVTVQGRYDGCVMNILVNDCVLID
jgi:hypothetical protein